MFRLVENSEGKRKTPTGVGFYNGKRNFERDLVNRKNKNIDTIFLYPLRFLGKSSGD